MAEVVCASCGQEFLARPQSPKQAYCSDPACQRERRRRWTRAKLEADPDYRANQLAAQRAWHARHPDYWHTYRERKHANAPPAPSRPTRATSDASFCGADPAAGRCWMEVLTHGPEGTPQAWRVEMTLTRPSVLQHGRVQTEDSWPAPTTPPNVPLHGFEIPVSVRRDA
jgi:hypothetical protein